jgi:tetratricopeptide (TPR) repeat protein
MTTNRFCDPPDDRGQYDRDFLSECLTTIDQQAHNHAWLMENVGCIHKILRAALNVAPLVHQAIGVFVRLVPFFMLIDDYADPLDNSMVALLQAMDLRDPNLMTQIAGAMASFSPFKGDIRRAFVSADTALGYVNAATDDDAKLHGCIRIIQAWSYRHFIGMPAHLISEAERLALISHDHFLVTEYHLTMAHLHIHRHEFDHAVEHAAIALTFADDLRADSFKMRALFMLGVAHRLRGDLEMAEGFIRDALDLRDGVKSKRRIGNLLCELANLRFEQREYAEAEKHYQEALAIFTELKMPYMIILAKHGLGIVWTVQERFDDARGVLNEVLDEYRWNGNLYGVADMKFALGRLEARARRPRIARQYLRGAEGLLKRLEPTPAHEKLLHWVRWWRGRVESGEFGELWRRHNGRAWT